MSKTQHADILKKFQSGNFSEAIELWADELKKNALNESLHQTLIHAKEHLEEIQGDGTSKKVLSGKISALQSFFDITFAGKFRQSSGGKSAESPISGIKETADGDIVISDDFNHRIQIYDKDFHLKLSFGQKGGSPGDFYYPKGIDIDEEENIYVADCWNNRIQKFTKDGKFILAFGSYGSEPSQFHEPVSIAINNDQLLVVDRCNHRIQFLNECGNYQGHIGHRGRVIEENLAELFETPQEKFTIPSLEFPSDIAFDSKKDIYIVDSHNHRISKFSSNGKFMLSFGRQGKEQGEFLYPLSIAIDRFDNIFISDLNNNRIQVFSPVGEHYFSFSRNGGKENIDSPTVLTCGKDCSVYVGLAFHPMILNFKYSQISQKERNSIKEDFNKNSALSLCFSGNFFNSEQDWAEASGKYEESLSIISAKREKIIPKLPLNYLDATRKIQKEDISPHLMDYYENELCRLNGSILDIYQKRKALTEKLIDPTLKDEKNIIEEKLTSGEIDKNLYELNNIERDLFRKTRETLLELKRMEGCQRELFLQLLSKMLSKQDNDGIKALVQKSLFTFYQHLDLCNRFLDDHDKQNSKCFEEIQRGTKGSFNLKEFRLAYELMEVAEDFIKLAFPILRSSTHLLSQLALKKSTSKSASIIEFYASLTEDSNIRKMGSALFKLRYDFEAILQLKESLRVLFSYLKLNSEEIISSILNNRSFDKDSLLDKDIFNYEKDLIKLLFMEEIGVVERKNGFRIGLFYINDSGLDSLQLQVSTNSEGKYNELLNDLKEAINQLLIEKKELNKLILKHERNLKSIHPADQKTRLQITNEYNLVNAQSAFGNKLILEHFFLYRIINFKRCLYLFLDSELKRKIKDEKRIKEICNKIDNYCNDISKTLEVLNESRKNIADNYILLENNLKNLENKPPSEIDRVKEIDLSNKLFQFSKEKQLAEISKSEYASVINFQGEVIRYLTQKNQSQTGITDVSHNVEFRHDMQFGSLGNNDGQFLIPKFLCSNTKGEIFVAEISNHRIQKFDLHGNHILTFGGIGDLNGFFKQPGGIVCDENNNLYVCDTLNHRIQKFDSNGKHLLSWGTFGNKTGCFNLPYSLCCDDKRFLYVTDVGNRRIQKFTSDGQFILSFEKQVDTNEKPIRHEVISYHKGAILIGETASDRIQQYSSDGKFIKSFNYSEGTPSNLQTTSNISVDKDGLIYVCEFWTNKVYVLSEGFRLVSSISSSEKFQVHFDAPCGVAFADKYMFICDHMHHRIHRFIIVTSQT